MNEMLALAALPSFPRKRRLALVGLIDRVRLTTTGPTPPHLKQIRGMLPHKTFRGAQALARLTTFEGIPAPYDTKKRVVVPQALKVRPSAVRAAVSLPRSLPCARVCVCRLSPLLATCGVTLSYLFCSSTPPSPPS